MADKSKIEWTEATWNPVTGCSKVSPGCAHCYAEAISRRFGHSPAPWTPENAEVNVQLHPERLDQPYRWKKPRRIFVNSMSDLFHELVPSDMIANVFSVMGDNPRHTFQVLTKRADRMRKWLGEVESYARQGQNEDWDAVTMNYPRYLADRLTHESQWPLSNVWLGVSVENQYWADERIPYLAETPAAVRFLSCEPLLKPVDLMDHLDRIDWVIVGGESGPGARPMSVEWVRDLIDQCKCARVPIFVKQLGTAWSKTADAKNRKGEDPSEWPDDIRIREYPNG